LHAGHHLLLSAGGEGGNTRDFRPGMMEPMREVERITARAAAAAAVRVHVTNPRRGEERVSLHDGDEFRFGRTQKGVARISGDEAVSRVHGILSVTAVGFSLVTTGSQIGVSVADRTTPSRLVIPRGVGPVPVPFRDCSIIVELGASRDYLDVLVEGSSLADSWDAAWGPQMRDQWFVDDEGSSDGELATRTARFAGGRGRSRWRKANGRPYAWFRTLVALCEPALGDAPAGTPSNPELCRRLIQRKSVTERHLTQIYEAFDLFDEARDRDVAVIRAIDLGIVTRKDLEIL
jgi:hypothetical protein